MQGFIKQGFMSYHVNRKKLDNNAENNTVVTTTGSNQSYISKQTLLDVSVH